MQAGTWTAIGFPVTEKAERNRFYSFSNWCYQLGVFISRSSGMIFQVLPLAPLPLLHNATVQGQLLTEVDAVTRSFECTAKDIM